MRGVAFASRSECYEDEGDEQEDYGTNSNAYPYSCSGSVSLRLNKNK